MVHSTRHEKLGLKKGPWTPEEDQKLVAYMEEHGHGSSWQALPTKAGLQRCGKSCRLRWTNYLRPDIKRGKFNLQEEQTIIQLHALLGNRWSSITAYLPKRTDNEIKNYWNTHLKKKLTKMGVDPATHKPKSKATLGSSSSKDMSNYLSHMAQWESTRLEAEARNVQKSMLNPSPNPKPVPNQLGVGPSSSWAHQAMDTLGLVVHDVFIPTVGPTVFPDNPETRLRDLMTSYLAKGRAASLEDNYMFRITDLMEGLSNMSELDTIVRSSSTTSIHGDSINLMSDNNMINWNNINGSLSFGGVFEENNNYYWNNTVSNFVSVSPSGLHVF